MVRHVSPINALASVVGLAIVVSSCGGSPASSPEVYGSHAPTSTNASSVQPATIPLDEPSIGVSPPPSSLPQATQTEAADKKGIIVDHNCTDLSSIPNQWTEIVKADIRLTFWHASHGDQINVGLDLLKQLHPEYAFAYEAIWENYGIGGNTNSTELDPPMKFDRITRQYLTANDGRPNMIAWSWCGGLTDYNQLGAGASAEQVDNYLRAMSKLELDYPTVKFIYMTAHVDGSGLNGTTNLRNQQIRAYCRSNGKILFDFADIESYDPSGRSFLENGANQDCSYDGGNWADEWGRSNPGSELNFAGKYDPVDTDHTRIQNCNLKGRAFWYLLVRVAGWSGS